MSSLCIPAWIEEKIEFKFRFISYYSYLNNLHIALWRLQKKSSENRSQIYYVNSHLKYAIFPKYNQFYLPYICRIYWNWAFPHISVSGLVCPPTIKNSGDITFHYSGHPTLHYRGDLTFYYSGDPTSHYHGDLTFYYSGDPTLHYHGDLTLDYITRQSGSWGLITD